AGACQRAHPAARPGPRPHRRRLFRGAGMTTANNLVQGLLLGGLYALFATGLSLMFGVMRLVNLAPGDFAILAAFLALVAVDATGVHPLLTLTVVVPAMVILGYRLQGGGPDRPG